MTRRLLPTLALLGATMQAFAKPPEILKIVNAASQLHPYLANDEIAPGSLITIWGRDLESSSGKTTVAISSAALRVLQVTLDRIEARVPEAIPLGRSELTVKSGNETSKAIPVILVPSRFGLFDRIDELLASGSRTRNSASNSAPPGSTVVLSGTGLGNAERPEVLVAGKSAQVVSVTKAPADGGAGDEIKAVLPADAPEGCFVPVQVRGAGRPSNIVPIAIRRSETWCAPPGYLPLADRSVTSAGLLAAARTVFHPLQGSDVDFDEAGGSFGRLDPAKLNPILAAPPLGSCAAHAEDAEIGAAGRPSLLDLLFGHSAILLNAGEFLTINDGRIQRRLLSRPARPNLYYSWLNDLSGLESSGPLDSFLAPARLQIAGMGGADIGAFHVELAGPPAFAWTDRVSSIDRARGLDVHWENAGADRVILILLTFEDKSSNTRGLAFCAAQAEHGSFRVPPEALAAFPEIPADSASARATLLVVSWPARPESFSAKGLDRGIGVSAFAHSANVTLQ